MTSKRTFSLTTAAAIALFAAAPAMAQDTLTAYAVHGIPGDDLGLDPALPVDVWVGDLGCAIPGFEFGERVGPLEIPAGSYDITISLEDEQNPCGGTAVISLPGVVLPGGANATVIAHRTADGSPGDGDQLDLGVTVSIFANDFTVTGRGKARILAHHTALAPTVDVVLSRNYSNSNAPSVTVPGFTNPTADEDAVLSQINAEFRPGKWDVALEVGGDTVFGPDRLKLKPSTSTYVYAVGVFGDTFQYLVYTERGLRFEKGAQQSKDRPRRDR